MHPGFIWIFILITQISPIVFSAEPIGILEVQIYYQNVKGLVPNGESCDSFIFGRLCDIFFEICLTEEGDPRSCNVFFVTTSPTRNTASANKSIAINYYTNKKHNLKIKVLDHDHLSTPDELGEFFYSFFPNSLVSERRIEEVEGKGAHPTSKMTLRVSKTCAFNHFGDECLLCNIPEDRGYCDSYGTPLCYPGYSGFNCSLVDGCHNLTCAPFARCQRIKESFACLCDNTAGERCEEGYDPCEEHICEHGGTCVRTGVHMNFAKCVNCNSGWVGPHCERKLDACELEALKLGRPPCANGGRCTISPTNDTISTCLCSPGWQGDRCDVSTSSKASALVTIILICIPISIACCIIAIVCCCRIYFRPKLRGIELTQVKTGNNELSRANNLYEVAQNQMKSQDNSYSVIWKQNGAPLKTIPQTSPVNGDDDYETMLDHREKSCSTSTAPKIVEEQEDYEPISYKFHGILPSIVVGASNNSYGQVTYNNSMKATSRPLPSEPPVEDYEYL
ncbi:hypothetical protein Aperf_G00000094076 [Anoplocephala perfoliata]